MSENLKVRRLIVQRKLTRATIIALRQAVQKFEEQRFPDYNVAVAVRATTDELGQPLVMISRSRRSIQEE
jgi:hypothetical protein